MQQGDGGTIKIGKAHKHMQMHSRAFSERSVAYSILFYINFWKVSFFCLMKKW